MIKSVVRKYLIVLIAVFLVVFGVRELLGHGFYTTGQCAKNYRFDRCLGIGVDAPEVIVDDFYALTRQGIKSSTPDELSEAGNLIRERLAESKSEKDADKPLTWSDFMKFWSMEVRDFIELDRDLSPRSSGIYGFRLKHCYSRKKDWLSLPENQGLLPWLCSSNYFELHPKKNNHHGPYSWEVSAMMFGSCSAADVDQCEKFNESLDQENEH